MFLHNYKYDKLREVREFYYDKDDKMFHYRIVSHEFTFIHRKTQVQGWFLNRNDYPMSGDEVLVCIDKNIHRHIVHSVYDLNDGQPTILVYLSNGDRVMVFWGDWILV